MKKYLNAAIIYAILAMVGGVFYREFTKYLGFTGYTTLSVLHTHYFVLGMFAFLILSLLEKNFSFTDAKTGRILIAYHAGLNLTVVMLFVRGIAQVTTDRLTSGSDGMISGIAGLGHLMLGISLIFLLLKIKGKVSKS